MENTDLAGLLHRHDFEVVPDAELLSAEPPAPATPGTMLVISGRRRLGSRTIDAQLQRYNRRKSVHYYAIARVAGPGLVGEGAFRPLPLMNSPLIFILVCVITFGLWGLVHLGDWVGRRLIEKMKRFDALRSPELTSFQVEGKELEAARDAFPHARQQRLAKIPFAGTTTVRDGWLTLYVQSTGYHRNVFEELLEAVDAIAAEGAP